MEKPFKAYKGDAPYIFVSYSHDDADVVYEDIRHLNESGFNIWYDEGISPGSTWRDEVALALTQSKVFLYYISPRAIRSENCLQELNFALSRERKVLAVHIEPTKLTMGVELSLSNKQAIMKADHSKQIYFDKLEQSLTSLLPSVAPLELAIRSKLAEQTAHPPDQKSIAILPLTNRSSDEEIEYLCDGIAEELIGGLSKLDELRVASQLSTFGLKNQGHDINTIGARLNVSHVLSGSIQKSGERVRVNISLNDVASDKAIWSERYDGTLEDVFEFQESVARNVVNALQIELAGDKQNISLIDSGTDNATAYNAFLLGRHHFLTLSARGLTMALDHMHRAIVLDPEFGRAHYYIYLCNLLSHQIFGGAREPLIDSARAAAEKIWATDFAPPIPRVYIQRTLDDKWPSERDRALESMEKIQTPDADWQGYQFWQLGIQLAHTGFIKGSLAYLDLYRNTMPQSVIESSNFSDYYCTVLEHLGHFEVEIEYISQQLAINPDIPMQLGVRAMTYSRTGQYKNAEEDLRELTKIFPRNFAQFYHLFWSREIEAAREYYAWLESQPRLQPLFKYWGAFLLGDIDKGLDYLQASEGDLWGIKTGSVRCLPQSRAREVWDHPRHRAMTESFGITDAWREELLERVNQITPITGITVKPDEEY